MKIALDWMAEYLSPVPAASVAADALMNAGLPVESVTDAAGVKGPTQVLDVEVTSNRTDCFCHVGLARELAALISGVFTMPKIAVAESATPTASLTRVDVNDPAGCPMYVARVIQNVKVGPSPEWLRRRLESIGLRPVNNVVDVTNFVLMELGQPLHAFDFDKLAEKRIVVRRAAAGEKMVAIDGREYALEPSMLVIADAKQPVAIAGVMGGKATEVTEQTTSILLESARFEPLTIRTTSRALGLKSDSSFRFERGIDPMMAELASKRAAQLILQIAGGELAQGAVVAGSPHDGGKRAQVSMRLARFQQIVGIHVAEERAIAILTALGFAPWMDEGASCGPEDDVLHTRVPSHRLDVEREIDLIEEVARVHGYGNIPTLDRVSHAVAPESVREKAMRAVRAAMVEAGFSETVTVTFVPEEAAAAFVGDGAAIRTQHAGWKTDVLRPSLLPSLLAARRTNQYAGLADAHVFETAATFVQRGDAKTAPPTERRMLAAVAGDVATLTALFGVLADRVNPALRFSVELADTPFFVAGAAGHVILHAAGAAAAVGHVGLFTPELQKKYDLRHAAAGLELDLEALLAAFAPLRRATAVPRYPGVTRDLSVVVDEAVRWADVQGAILAAKLAFLERVEFVTTFRNAQVGAGKKSLTLTLNFRDPARTLKSEEVDAQVAAAVKVLGEKFGAMLRA